MTILQEISTLPPAPQRTDPPAVFVPKADAHVASLDAFVTQINSFGDEVNTTQSEMNAAAQSASDSEAAAAQSALTADSAANFKGKWSSLSGALTVPSSVEHANLAWQLLNNLADVSLSEPGTNADWLEINPNNAASLSDGGSLSASLLNQVQDSDTYYLPSASDYIAGKYIDVEKSDENKENTPIIEIKAGSGNNITYSGGNDTSAQLNQKNAECRRFTTDGVNNWSLS